MPSSRAFAPIGLPFSTPMPTFLAKRESLNELLGFASGAAALSSASASFTSAAPFAAPVVVVVVVVVVAVAVPSSPMSNSLLSSASTTRSRFALRTPHLLRVMALRVLDGFSIAPPRFVVGIAAGLNTIDARRTMPLADMEGRFTRESRGRGTSVGGRRVFGASELLGEWDPLVRDGVLEGDANDVFVEEEEEEEELVL